VKVANSKEDSGKTETATRVAAVSSHRDKESGDNKMSLGGVRRHWQSKKGASKESFKPQKGCQHSG